MTEESSTTSQLSVAMTTTGMTQITGENTTISSSSRSAQFYFLCVAIVIGVIGTAANALIIYALVASKQHKKHALIVNQNALDLFSSFFMVVTYSLRLCNIHLTGSVGYWLCALLLSDNLIWLGTVGSCISLASITVERYLKVVHPAWSQMKLRNWMIYAAAAFAWIGSFIYNTVTVLLTTVVKDGRCYPYQFWKNGMNPIVHAMWSFVSFYVIILLIFILCYWRILIVIRRQARVMASHNHTGPGTSQTISNQIQTNVIKTMIFVSAFYAISWMPHHVYVVYRSLYPNTIGGWIYNALTSIAFLFTCTNPFVYATKFDPVKQVLLRLILCKKTSE